MERRCVVAAGGEGGEGGVLMACMNSSQHRQTNHVAIRGTMSVKLHADRLLAEAALWPGCQQRGRG